MTVKSTLTDDKIVELAKDIDQFIMQMGEKYSPTGIEFASIMLGRTLVFTKHVKAFDQFHQLLTAVANMKDGDPLIPDEPLND